MEAQFVQNFISLTPPESLHSEHMHSNNEADTMVGSIASSLMVHKNEQDYSNYLNTILSNLKVLLHERHKESKVCNKKSRSLNKINNNINKKKPASVNVQSHTKIVKLFDLKKKIDDFQQQLKENCTKRMYNQLKNKRGNKTAPNYVNKLSQNVMIKNKNFKLSQSANKITTDKLGVLKESCNKNLDNSSSPDIDLGVSKEKCTLINKTISEVDVNRVLEKSFKSSNTCHENFESNVSNSNKFKKNISNNSIDEPLEEIILQSKNTKITSNQKIMDSNDPYIVSEINSSLDYLIDNSDNESIKSIILSETSSSRLGKNISSLNEVSYQENIDTTNFSTLNEIFEIKKIKVDTNELKQELGCYKPLNIKLEDTNTIKTSNDISHLQLMKQNPTSKFHNEKSISSKKPKKEDDFKEECLLEMIKEKYDQGVYTPSAELLEKLQDTDIVVNWDIPELHKKTCDYFKSTMEKRNMLKKCYFKEGYFTEEEDYIIRKNWHLFSEIYNFDEPRVFCYFKDIKNSFGRINQRKFKQFLARGLPYRAVFQVYGRFQRLYSSVVTGKWNKEDTNIVKYCKKNHFFGDRPFQDLGIVLNRKPETVVRKIKQLEQSENRQIKWTLDELESFLRVLLMVTEVKSYKNLENIKIDLRTWKNMETVFKVPFMKLRRLWLEKFHMQLFATEPIFIKNINEHIINRLYEWNIDDWKHFDYGIIAKEIRGATNLFISNTFRYFLNSHVPKDIRENFLESITYLKENFHKFKIYNKKLQRYRYYNGHLYPIKD